MTKWLIGIGLAGAAAFLASERAPPAQTVPDAPSAVTASPDGRRAAHIAAAGAPVAPAGSPTAVESTVPHPADRELTPAEQAARERWLVEHGYFSTDYAGYPQAVLREMIALGDRIALEALADRLKATAPLEAIDLSRRAALLGSTGAMHRTLNIHRSLARGQPGRDVDPARVELINAYAWGLVLQMRGDPSGASSNLDIQLREALEAHEVEVACALAGDFYADLSAERRAAGLRAFDNTPPPVASVDLGRAGEMCARWPVPRASCRRDAGLPAAVTLHAYRCELPGPDAGRYASR